jgi:SAM-dependent MidA family methyltransferase
MTIANYLKTAHEHYLKQEGRDKIRIVEAGAGTGSAAESILYFFSNYHRELLPLIEYNIVEISPTLAKRIEQKLSKTYPHLVKNKQIKIINQDISDYKISEPCFTLFFEVLDNLPHDKALWNPSLNRYDKFVTVDVDTN